MKLWKKIILALFVLLLLVQIPFIYNRFQTGKLSDKINQLQNQRSNTANQKYRDLKGAIHVHTALGGHSTGGFDELIEGAAANNLDFVVMTEHTAENFDTSALTLNGFYGNTLFIGGNELDTKSEDRFLLISSDAEAQFGKSDRNAGILKKISRQKSDRFYYLS